MQAEFRAPRRRRRVHDGYEAPLPVGGSREERSHLRAELINQHVVVCHPDDIQKIHNQGYFGKGVLSRAKPDHCISDQWEQHNGLLLPVLSESRYEERLRWAGSALSARGLDDEEVRQTLWRLSQPIDMKDMKTDMAEENRHGGGWGKKMDGPRPVGGVCPFTKQHRSRSQAELATKRRCSLEPQDMNLDLSSLQRSESNCGPHSDPSPSSDCDPEPLVPGPGLVLVVGEREVDGGIREVRQNPFSLSEYLQLSLEEAFFLVYGLGCLSVYLQEEPLTIIQLWQTFRSLHPDFVSSYAAYHHFRSRGWVPKGGGGAKYGVDLMLYRKGPPFYHASYSVVIEKVDPASKGSASRPFSWRSLAALNRITSSVSKELMLCYIIYPTGQSEAQLDSPECLSRLKVQKVIVSRWVSSKERAEQDDI